MADQRTEIKSGRPASAGEGMMPTYEVRGPDRTGNYWVVEIEAKGAVISETALAESYPSKEEAQAAANKKNRR